MLNVISRQTCKTNLRFVKINLAPAPPSTDSLSNSANLKPLDTNQLGLFLTFFNCALRKGTFFSFYALGKLLLISKSPNLHLRIIQASSTEGSPPCVRQFCSLGSSYLLSFFSLLKLPLLIV